MFPLYSQHDQILTGKYRHLAQIETFSTKLKLNSMAFSPQANYTDRAAAACRRGYCKLLQIEGVTWSAQRTPAAVNLSFQVAPQLSSRG
jgi:hypothetical protein